MYRRHRNNFKCRLDNFLMGFILYILLHVTLITVIVKIKNVAMKYAGTVLKRSI